MRWARFDCRAYARGRCKQDRAEVYDEHDLPLVPHQGAPPLRVPLCAADSHAPAGLDDPHSPDAGCTERRPEDRRKRPARSPLLTRLKRTPIAPAARRCTRTVTVSGRSILRVPGRLAQEPLDGFDPGLASRAVLQLLSRPLVATHERGSCPDDPDMSVHVQPTADALFVRCW